jgi:uncharacterized HAD superfamily protein
MSYMGDYKMRQAEEAEAAVNRAVDEAAALDELSRAKKEITEAKEAVFETAQSVALNEAEYEDWQEQQIESLHRNMIAAADGLRSHWGWTKEDLRLALEHEDLI